MKELFTKSVKLLDADQDSIQGPLAYEAETIPLDHSRQNISINKYLFQLMDQKMYILPQNLINQGFQGQIQDLI